MHAEAKYVCFYTILTTGMIPSVSIWRNVSMLNPHTHRANLRKKTDPSYAALLKVRPLDAYSTQRLNDVRAHFLQTEQSIGDVNSQLDAQFEKKNEERRQAGR